MGEVKNQIMKKERERKKVIFTLRTVAVKNNREKMLSEKGNNHFLSLETPVNMRPFCGHFI